MTLGINKYDKILDAFVSVCRGSDLLAKRKREVVHSEIVTVILMTGSIVGEQSASMTNIGRACSKFAANDLLLDASTNPCDDCIEVTYCMRLNLVRCLKEVYNILSATRDPSSMSETASVKEKARNLMKSSESNIRMLKSFEALFIK